MKQNFLKILAFIALIALGGCNESQLETNVISGKLTLFLRQQQATDLYVRYVLKEHLSETETVEIVSSGFNKIIQHPIQFSLTYPVDKINQQKKYTLFVTIAEDPAGKSEVSAMSIPVLTQGEPSRLNLVLKPLVTPVE